MLNNNLREAWVSATMEIVAKRYAKYKSRPNETQVSSIIETKIADGLIDGDRFQVGGHISTDQFFSDAARGIIEKKLTTIDEREAKASHEELSTTQMSARALMRSYSVAFERKPQGFS